MRIFDNPNYNFVKWRWHAVVLSLVLIGIGVALFVTRSVNMGIDFAGGATITLKFKEAVPLDVLRRQPALGNATIQQYGSADQNSALIRLPQQKREGDYAGEVVKELHKSLNPESASGKLDVNYVGRDQLAAIFQQADPDNRGSQPAAIDHYRNVARNIIEKRSSLGIYKSMNEATTAPGVSTGIARVLNEKTFIGRFVLLNQETVGPQVGEELQWKAFWAIVLSSLAMGIYIWIRFDIGFGVAAIACIIHDVAICLAFMLAMNLEFTLNIVAALLTIVGYSINDTVVLYDRVRENKKKIKKPMSLGEHLNLAMNQTLSRTILTSGTVFLVLLALLAFGGEVIRGFSWILTIGVISGTYSTLLIVPAVALAWDRFRGRPVPAGATARIEPTRDAMPSQPRKARKSA